MARSHSHAEAKLGLEPRWPVLNHTARLSCMVFLPWEAISFSLQEWKLLGGPREEAWPHSLRNSGHCLEEEEPELSRGSQSPWRSQEGTVPRACAGQFADSRYLSTWLKPFLPVELLLAPRKSRKTRSRRFSSPPSALDIVSMKIYQNPLPTPVQQQLCKGGSFCGVSTHPLCPASCPHMLFHPFISPSLCASLGGLCLHLSQGPSHKILR